MFGAMATVVGYARKPKATYYLRHPVKAVRIQRFRNDVKETFTPQRIALGLGAAAVAVPLGVWLGRKVGVGVPQGEEVEVGGEVAVAGGVAD